MSEVRETRRPLIVRYSAAQRINHWIIAISFVLLTVSGLALFHPIFYWMSNLFGSGTWARMIHPWIGVVIVVFFAMFAARMWRNNRMESRDWQWLRHGRDVISKREERVPESGRYNAGQKIMYFAQIILLLALLITGIVMWRQYFWIGLFPIGVIRLASLLHAFFAFLFIVAIIIHIYAGIWVKGSVRAMTRGTVTPGWAWKNHRVWWRSMRGQRHPR